MNIVTVTPDRLVVEPVGLDKLWGLRRRLEYRLEQVRGATYDPGAAQSPKGLRGPGLALPGLKWVGTFHRDGERQFWNVVRGHQTVEIELADADVARLFLTVGDARAVVDQVNAAIAA